MHTKILHKLDFNEGKKLDKLSKKKVTKKNEEGWEETKCPTCGALWDNESTMEDEDDSGNVGVFPKCQKCGARVSDIALSWKEDESKKLDKLSKKKAVNKKAVKEESEGSEIIKGTDFGQGQNSKEGWTTKIHQDAFSELVSRSGAADTIEGELVRAVNKIIYRWYNDGDKFFDGYGVETAGPCIEFIRNTGEEFGMNDIDILIGEGEKSDADEKYEKFLSDLEDAEMNMLATAAGSYTKNTDDMLADKYVNLANDRYGSSNRDEDYYDDGIEESNKAVNKKAVKEERGKGLGVGGDRQVDGGSDICICPNACGYEIEHVKGTPCNEMKCPTCDIPLIGKNIEQKEEKVLLGDKLTSDDVEELEQKHNVFIDAEHLLFNITDTESGWRAIPQDWFKELKQKEEKAMKFNKNLLSAFKKVAEAKDKDPKNVKELSTAMVEMKLVEESKAVLKLKAKEVVAYAKEAIKVEKKDVKESGIYKDYFARVRDAIDLADNAFKEGDTESVLSAMQDALKEVNDCIVELESVEPERDIVPEIDIEPEIELESKDVKKKKKKDTKTKDTSLKSWAKMQDNLIKGVYKAESKEVTDAVAKILEGEDVTETIEKV